MKTIFSHNGGAKIVEAYTWIITMSIDPYRHNTGVSISTIGEYLVGHICGLTLKKSSVLESLVDYPVATYGHQLPGDASKVCLESLFRLCWLFVATRFP